MRSYPTNSPEAAARIVALALLVDGHLCHREMAVLNRLSVASELGLSADRLQHVVQAFCEDVQHGERLAWSGGGALGSEVLRPLLAEIDDPALRLRLAGLCARLMTADGRVTDGEAWVLAEMVAQWGVPLVPAPVAEWPLAA